MFIYLMFGNSSRCKRDINNLTSSLQLSNSLFKFVYLLLLSLNNGNELFSRGRFYVHTKQTIPETISLLQVCSLSVNSYKKNGCLTRCYEHAYTVPLWHRLKNKQFKQHYQELGSMR